MYRKCTKKAGSMGKMIYQTLVLWLILLKSTDGHPRRQQQFTFPQFEKSSPQEVNSLELEEPLTIRRSIDTNNRQTNNIEDTIKEVEGIIKTNPDLPRLTRGEILDLIENITKTDAQKKSPIFSNNVSQSRDSKSIMLVMPYTPSKDDKNMADLYTKAPVTRIVASEAEPFKSRNEQRVRRPTIKFSDTVTSARPVIQETTPTSISVATSRSRRRRPQVTSPSPSTVEVSTYRGTRPVRRKSTQTISSTTQHPNHRYTEDDYSSGIRIIESPKLSTVKHTSSLEDLSASENTRNDIVWQQKLTTTTTDLPMLESIIPESLKSVMQNMNLESAINPPKPVKNQVDENKIKNMLSAVGIFPATTSTTTTTTTTAMPNAENVAESLSPEMRDLLVSFGLLPNPSEKIVEHTGTYNPEKAEVKADSYVGFKPLPEDGPGRDDMDALLASFGLGRSSRRQKSVKNEDGGYNLEVIPESFKSVIADMGLKENQKNLREGKKIRDSVEKQHVFNPDTQYASEEELLKLDKLMSVIKQLEKLNGTATEEDLKKIDVEGLKELVGSLNINADQEEFETLDDKGNFGPDPTKFDAGLLKNEIKRQESTTVVTSISSSSTEAEAETPSIVDLEASFGGQVEVASTTTTTEAPETTTHRRTGFYRLVDWNTFFDIDDTKGRRVNLRFQPKVGDPSRFYSVTVP